MRANRTITRLAVLGTVAVGLGPASASGNPLLSGYGRPGEASQVILGAALLNGPRGGGAGGGGAGGGSGRTTPPSSNGAPDGGQGSNASSGACCGPQSGSAAKARRSTGNGGETAVSGQVNDDATREPLASSSAGLAASDVVLICLALAALALTAALTRRLARTNASGPHA